VTILPLGLLQVFPAEETLSFDTKIFNTCGPFHLLTNISKENKEISPFLEGGKKDYL
jgi:hypothetical protein